MYPGSVLAEGYIVSDRFQLLRLLGRGGMGSVWVARHLSLNIDVAIKFIDGALSGRDDLRSRFAQEARTAARIQSPNVVSILDYGFDGERPYIAMELLHGESLSARLERERRIPVAEVATILTQAAKGLAKAHALGIVHRDLKPDNLFLVRDEDGSVLVKVLDFGIARDETPLGTGSHRTGTGQLLGTPAYMSPEQVLGRAHIDFRSDLYALAVVVYHCVLGRLPFESDALGELIVSISMKDPPLPSSLGLPGVPAGLDGWFTRAFQKDAAARFGSAKEMADMFALACRDVSPAYDRTVLATDAGSGPNVARFSTPDPRLSPGVIAASTPAPTAGWSLAGAPAPRISGLPHLTPPGAQEMAMTGPVTPFIDRSSAHGGQSGPEGSRAMGQASSVPPYDPRAQTAPWSRGVPTGQGAPGGPPPGTAMMTSSPVRIPDTFNGQSATQPETPQIPTRGPSPLVVGLIGVIVLAGLGGAGIYALRARTTAAAGPGTGLVGSADSASPVPLTTPSGGSLAPATVAPPPPVVPVETASAASHPPPVVHEPPAHEPVHEAPHHPPSPPVTLKPSASPTPPAPTPAPKPRTTDYGL